MKQLILTSSTVSRMDPRRCLTLRLTELLSTRTWVNSVNRRATYVKPFCPACPCDKRACTYGIISCACNAFLVPSGGGGFRYGSVEMACTNGTTETRIPFLVPCYAATSSAGIVNTMLHGDESAAKNGRSRSTTMGPRVKAFDFNCPFGRI